jgi:hypothetical protein
MTNRDKRVARKRREHENRAKGFAAMFDRFQAEHSDNIQKGGYTLGQAKRVWTKRKAVEVGVKRMPREQQVFLYVLCCLEDLARAEGQGGVRRVAVEWREAFEWMVGDGFEPSEIEVDRVIQFMVQKGMVDIGVPSDEEIRKQAALKKKIATIH